MLKVLAGTIRKGHEWGIPIMAEMMPGGFGAAPEFRTTEAISHAARVAAELGADWVKVPFCDRFNRVVESSYVPVVVLGGPNDPDKRKTLEIVKQSMEQGARGATIGRNIWQSQDTKKMTAAVRAIIHDGASVNEAMEILER
jgi:DhnA family fructose-bisphosphate aldolase class Ia